MKWILVGALSLFPVASLAASGEVCLAEKTMSGKSPGELEVTNQGKFVCPTAGTDTIPGLYKKGWRVVAIFPQTEGNPLTGPITGRWTIIIERL